jgi:hypothetical protein
MQQAWHHGTRVTSGHPIGGWAQGWDEVLAMWKGTGPATSRSTGTATWPTRCARSLRRRPLADRLSRVRALPCKEDGAWKIVHHDADEPPAVGARAQEAGAVRSTTIRIMFCIGSSTTNGARKWRAICFGDTELPDEHDPASGRPTCVQAWRTAGGKTRQGSSTAPRVPCPAGSQGDRF